MLRIVLLQEPVFRLSRCHAILYSFLTVNLINLINRLLEVFLSLVYFKDNSIPDQSLQLQPCEIP